jgi:hypothetical protein
VSQLVDQDHLGMALEDRVEIHLLETRAPVLRHQWADHLEVFHQRLGPPASMAFDEPEHDIGATLLAPTPFAQHGVRLAHPRGRAQIDPEAAPSTDHSGVRGAVGRTAAFDRLMPRPAHDGPPLVEVTLNRRPEGRRPN